MTFCAMTACSETKAPHKGCRREKLGVDHFTILAINIRTVGVLVGLLTRSEQQTYQTASNI